MTTEQNQPLETVKYRKGKLIESLDIFHKPLVSLLWHFFTLGQK